MQNFNQIKNLLVTHGIDPRNKLGQNFLIDLNILNIVLSSGELTREDAVLEVGPGTGILTERLVDSAGFVLSVEIDRRFAELIRSLIPQGDRFELHVGDILSGKNHVDPEVLKKLREGMARQGCTRLKMVANLPYSVATPVLTNLILEGSIPWERMVGMVQLEIAERFVAKPGSSHYGGLAAMVGNLAGARILRKIPPTVFFPKPKVESAILEIRPDPEKIKDVETKLGKALPDTSGPLALRYFLRDLFLHRRKNLRGALIAMPQGKLISKTDVDSLLKTLDLPPETRAEDLDPQKLLELCRNWYSLLPENII